MDLYSSQLAHKEQCLVTLQWIVEVAQVPGISKYYTTRTRNWFDGGNLLKVYSIKYIRDPGSGD